MCSDANRIFLDLDGTLLNIEDRYLNLFKYMCNQYHIDNISEFNFWELKRKGFTNIQILNKFGYQDELPNDFHKKWVALVEDNAWLKFDSLQKDTKDFLNQLKIKNFDLYLLTGRNSRKNLIEQLKNLDIYVYFKNIFNVNTSNMIAEKKAVLKSHQPEYFVGDTEFDYLACKDLPVKFFCVSNGFRNYDFLKKNNIKNIYKNLTILMDEAL